MYSKTLFGFDTKGNVKVWEIKTVGAEIHVSHGRKDGKMQTKVTVAKGKNIGRSNETTPEEQAVLEAVSKVNKQMDKRYRETEEELALLGEAEEALLPMLAHDYTKVGHRMAYPCHVSPKLDGVRCLAIITPGSVEFRTRGGKAYDVPAHLFNELQSVLETSGLDKLILDGELYIHGVSLQNIVSCVKKENEMTKDLEFWIFDVPSEKAWRERYVDLSNIGVDLELTSPLKIVNNINCESEEHARQMLSYFMERGFEGIMLRNPDGPYQFNYRSPYLMKWKEFQDIEAKVIGIRRDKNDEGVLKCRLQSGVEFECKMVGSHEYRHFDSMMTLVGAWITVKFQQYTDGGAPQFPVGMNVRDCDEKGFPIV